MASSPLSNVSNAALNTTTPCSADNRSSPFVSQPEDNREPQGLKNQENVSPSKSRHSRILSGTELSPLKILKPRDDSNTDAPKPSSPSPRKMSPDKRFPIKVSPDKPPVEQREITLEDALRENQGLTQAIQIFEDEDTMMMDDHDHDESDIVAPDESVAPDDTMVSTFSTFSAVPNMTMFARLGHSPTRFANVGMTPTPRARPDSSSSKTPRPPVMHETGNTTNLLDFTEQLSSFASSRYSRQSRYTPSKTATMHTPQRSHAHNLLDFDIPPLPTPRSIPTITPRELESLKSSFLSEISSLKASLSGKEAEVLSLKTAVGDAEKRVGECMEQLREAQIVKDALAEEKLSWEKRGREMEGVLRKVKDEIVLSQRERAELESKLDESEKRREAAEIMAQEAESKMAGMRAGKITGGDGAGDPGNGGTSPEKQQCTGSREVEIAVERVARDLHALYKTKHENKVAALRKSYETRWEKKVRELESRVDEITDENERLKQGRDATMTKVDPNQTLLDEERRDQAAKDSAQIKKLDAEIEKLKAVIHSVKRDSNEMRQLLEKERVEKGELVMLAEEMMSMQSFVQQQQQQPPKEKQTPSRPAVAVPTKVPAAATTTDLNFRSSIGRASGLRAPGSVKKPSESRIGGGLTHERTRSNGPPHGGLPRPGSGMGARSGIMSSIERMGSYRTRAE
ncbi:central kinetochore-associated-domain-containing protein [Xylariomycetidae sp. FL2044]|nr:central kinetochore-associated-domain-containing protein [Xylariomycetidae sp. FL2044]